MKLRQDKSLCVTLFFPVLFLWTGKGCFGQRSISLPNASLFDSVKAVSRDLPCKVNLVYSFVTWCGGGPEDIQEMKDTLIKYRNEYNLIVIVDTTNHVYHKYLDFLKPDAILPFNMFFPECLHSRREQKQALAAYNSTFGRNEKLMGGSSGLFLLDCHGNFIVRLSLVDRPKRLKIFLEDLMGI